MKRIISHLAFSGKPGLEIASCKSEKAGVEGGYRADIDGLRAVAILSVILFHANPSYIPGGFVGVDVFFVISGFLITKLIASSIEQGSFSLVAFYNRRIRRIFPAYIVVALVTLIVASYLMIPNDYIFYTTSLAASWGFAANIFFSMLSWGYFGQRTEEFPLLHAWSLSVEEQFYFIFPILLILFYRYARKFIVPLLFILCMVFVMVSESKTGEAKSYFLLSSRAHELIIGALTCFFSEKIRTQNRIRSTCLAVVGSTLLLGALFLFDRHTSFPGIHSLYPCIGTALIILAGNSVNPVSRILKTRPMVLTGLISYSLYLWHWPIFSFLHYRRISITFMTGTAAILLAFLLAGLTWKFIERPVRFAKKVSFKRTLAWIYLAPAVAFMTVGLYSYVTEGAPLRFPSETRELISSYSFQRDLGRKCSIRSEDYRKIDTDYLVENCAFGDMTQDQAQVLLIGDSHADHFKPFVDELTKAAGLKAVFHVQGDCPPVALPDMEGTDATVCQKRNSDLLALSRNYKFVVLAGFWADKPYQNLERDLKNAISKIRGAGAIPVVFKDNAFFEPDPSKCILYKKRGWIPEDKNCHIPYDFVLKTQGPIDAIIDRVKEADPAVVVVDPKKIMCTPSECLTYIGNMALYKDANHINAKAAYFLGEKYRVNVSNPFMQVQFGNSLLHQDSGKT